MKFEIKVIRNGLILSGLFFISLWAGIDDISWQTLKPLAIFFIGYVLTEYIQHYKINSEALNKRGKLNISTIIF